MSGLSKYLIITYYLNIPLLIPSKDEKVLDLHCIQTDELLLQLRGGSFELVDDVSDRHVQEEGLVVVVHH